MRTLRRFLAATVMLLGTSAGAAGFEGLRSDPRDAPRAQAGRLAAVDAAARTLRIGGSTFVVPPDTRVDFGALEVGRPAVVSYREDRGRRVAIEVRTLGEHAH